MTGNERPALDANDVWFSYGAGRPVLRGVSLAAEAHRVTMILGVSGSGKSTLLKLCRGLLAPQRGTVHVLGDRVAASPRGRLDPRIAYIPQHLGLVRNRTALDNVLTGALARLRAVPSLLALAPRAEVARARELLERLGIGGKAAEGVYALSGGERQRVAIARALMQEPRVVLADEFVSQLDVLTTRDILTCVRGIAGEGVAVVVTTHEMELVERYADVVVVLRDGEKVLDRDATRQSVADLEVALR